MSTVPVGAVGAFVANVPSFGALEVGASIAMMFLGIATLQTWNYYRNFSGDPAFVKILVAVIYSADVLDSILVMHVAYYYTILGFAGVLTTSDPIALTIIPWTLSASVGVEIFMIFIVQSYFCLRIYRIWESPALALFCWILTLVRFGLGITVTVTCAQHPSVEVINMFAFRWTTIADHATGTLSDLCVAISTCVGLSRLRTGFKRTDHAVDRLMAYAIGSGAVTSLFSLVELITFLVVPTQYIWLAFLGIIPKLWSNSLLVSLNQRVGHQRQVSPLGPDSTGGVSTHVDFPKREGDTTIELQSFNESASKPVMNFRVDEQTMVRAV